MVFLTCRKLDDMEFCYQVVNVCILIAAGTHLYIDCKYHGIPIRIEGLIGRFRKYPKSIDYQGLVIHSSLFPKVANIV